MAVLYFHIGMVETGRNNTKYESTVLQWIIYIKTEYVQIIWNLVPNW